VNKALDELKIQAKILLKSVKANQALATQRLKRQYKSYQEESVYQPKLKHCQQVVACESGFSDWQHAHQILNACNLDIDEQVNMGEFWHDDRCNALLNYWFSQYAEAELFLKETPNTYLFPFNHQFIVATQDYVNAIGLYELDPTLWNTVQNNLVASYPSDEWDKVALARIKKRTL
jgi:hypothetical protein